MKTTRQISNIRSRLESNIKFLASCAKIPDVADKTINAILKDIETLYDEDCGDLATHYAEHLDQLTSRLFADN